MIQLRMSSFTYGPLVTQPGIPASLEDSAIPGSKQEFAEGEYGFVCLQNVQAGESNFLYTIWQAKEDIALDFRCNPETIQVHAAIKNDSLFQILGIGELYLCEGQFNLVESTRLEGSYYLDKGNEYRTLHIDISSSFLDRIIQALPKLEAWLASGSDTPRLLFKFPGWLSIPLRDILHQLLFNSYKGEVLQTYREIKALEFLLLLLSQDNESLTASTRLSRRNIDSIHQSRVIMEQGFDQHITISSMATQTGMNEFKLKAGFKQVYGMGMFEYLMQIRMQAARQLLLETDKPIKEIATLTGYATKQSFMHAFKKFFHDTPGSFRRT